MRLVALLLAAACGAWAQAPAPAFEVASVKLSAPRDSGSPAPPRVYRRITAGEAQFANYSLHSLLQFAYGVDRFQVSGPDWLNSVLLDVAAKMPAGARVEDAPALMKALLAERMGVKAHMDEAEFSILALRLGPDGLKLAAAPPDFKTGPNGEMPMSMDSVADFLMVSSPLPVRNQTGVEGKFVVPLRDLLIGNAVANLPAKAPVPGSGAAAELPAERSIHELLPAWGLRVQEQKTRLPRLVVESALKTPTEN